MHTAHLRRARTDAGLLLVVLLAAAALSWLPLELAAATLAAIAVAAATLCWPALPILLLAVFATWSPALPGVPMAPSQAPVGINEMLVVLTVLAWSLDGLRDRQLRWPPRSAIFILALFLWAKAISLTGAISPAAGISEWIKWAETAVVLLLLLALLPRWAVPWLLGGLLLGATAQALLGLWQFLAAQGPPAFLILDERFARAAGALRQPNPFGGLMGLSLPLALSLLLWWLTTQQQVSRPRWLVTSFTLALCTGLLALGLFASWSRGAWMGGAAATATVILLSGTRVILLATAGAGTALLTAALANLTVVPGTIQSRLADLPAYLGLIDVHRTPVTDANFAVLERLAYWHAAWQMFQVHPWTGVGLGNFVIAYPEYALPRWSEPLGHAHNYYLHVAAESGLLGLASYTVLIIGLAGIIARAWSVRGMSKTLAIGLAGACIHLAVHSLFDNLFVHGIYLHFAILVGAAIVSSQRLRSAKRSHGPA